ncbi:MAG: DUF1552 domain-containing protein [Planctomycetota bacterium]
MKASRQAGEGMSRRAALRGAGVAVALPWLECLAPARVARGAEAKPPRRMVAIETTMGLLPQYFFPATAGRSYEPTAYLKYLEPFRDRLTVFSGVSHPLVDGGHSADISFLTGAPHPASGNFRNTISLDQFAAEALGPETRFPSLSLAVAAQGATSLSFTRDGVLIPGERSPARLHRQMFLQGDPQTTAERVESLRAGRSVLDYVGSGARKLERVASAEDRQRLEQYFTAVRDLEDRMQRAEVWERRRKPRPKAPPPPEAPEQELFTLLRLMGRMIRMALETDSTRIVTLFVNPAQWVPRAPGVAHETHSLTHHGNRPEMIEELRTVEEQQFALLGELLAGLDEVREGQGTLLDQTMVLHGSCMGNANAHSNTHLPVLLAGGGFRHAGHLKFASHDEQPLANLYLSMLQQMGVEATSFATSTGTLRGLEPG